MSRKAQLQRDITTLLGYCGMHAFNGFLVGSTQKLVPFDLSPTLSAVLLVRFQLYGPYLIARMHVVDLRSASSLLAFKLWLYVVEGSSSTGC
jgi:hypothetical protein